MSFSEEAEWNEEDEYEFDPITNYLRMQEHSQDVFFEIKDYLHSQGERQLFRYLMWEDICEMLYDASDLELIEMVPESMR